VGVGPYKSLLRSILKDGSRSNHAIQDLAFSPCMKQELFTPVGTTQLFWPVKRDVLQKFLQR
jgi:hypothetical protein